jgi:diguanylate cyclase
MSMDPDENLLLQVHEPHQTAEYFRLAVARLRELDLSPSPLYYSLFFSYASGASKRLNEQMDALISNGQLNHDTAAGLMSGYLISCKTTLLEEIRAQILSTLGDSVKSLADTTGKTSASNRQIENHLQKLANVETDTEASDLLKDIVGITSNLLQESRQLENQLKASTESLETLREELFAARSEAQTDTLTGLNNRQSLNEKLDQLINDRRFKGRGFSLLMTDIDHFKQINDTYGHLVGDKVLKAFARLLESKTRESDFVARFGGEEFIIILPMTTLNNAFRVAENMRNAIEKMRLKPSRDNGNSQPMRALTASFGVGTFRDGETAEEVIDRVDKALYRAKNAGRNRTIIAQ